MINIAEGECKMNIFENNNGRRLNYPLVWMNEPAQWEFNNGVLSVEAPKASDFFIDPEGNGIRDSAPFFHCVVKGDFMITTRVDVNMKFTYDSACLMIMADDSHWAKLCYENWMDEPSIVSVVTKSYSDDCASYKVGKCKPFLRMIRKNSGVKFYYSLDGEEWVIIRYFNLQAQEVKLGVVAQCPTGEGCNIKFEALELRVI